ncbi:MAG TPA: NAD(P)-dependent oxidoreductase [Micropepsaceae bacterium]|jgi:precorrin-2 dehydrogenase/sirohydrochlorin ferrochelatase|nr:NAD(P)-dependent oxidoreductase [Micropepsaceae bacterium]
MLPIILDGSKVRAGLAGTGAGFDRRLKVMKAGGVDEPVTFIGRLPTANELATLQILFVAGLDEPTSRSLAAAARQAGLLVNVEDVPELCDFHMPAQIRRGDLLLAISTAGRSPALSRALREHLEIRFGAEWEGRLDEIAALRQAWRAAGVTPDEVSRRTRELLAERGWLA